MFRSMAGGDELKRITVWIDGKDNDVEQICKRLEKLLSSVGLQHKIVNVCEIKWLEYDK